MAKNNNYKKFGKDNTSLVKFDIDDLDDFESMQYDTFSKSMDKADVLQILINNVEGDYSQLSIGLSEIAEEQYPTDEWDDDNRQEYKTGGEVGKVANVLAEYKKAIDKSVADNIKHFKRDKKMIEMLEQDKADHYNVIDCMKEGNWKQAYKSWANMDTASREEITNQAYELLNEKNGYPTYAKGGYVFKGDKYQFVPAKFNYTIGGL